ncbi:hypothetical protein BDV93DRAFT_454477 [Ceratobasidium sp. AG-I]|nr:hypothetical protein BDV93DRAFT_454477 [Ceratobasidium sp. AG-I]
MLFSEVTSFNKELAKKAHIEPPLSPGADLTQDDCKAVQIQLQDLRALPLNLRQIVWHEFTASQLTPLTTALCVLSQDTQPLAVNTLIQVLSLVPDYEPERYYRRFLYSPQSRGLADAVGRAFVRGVEYKRPSGLNAIGNLLYQLQIWGNEKQSDDGLSVFNSDVRKALTAKLDHDLRHDPALIEYLNRNPKFMMLRALFHLQLSEYTTEESMSAQFRPQIEGQSEYCRRGDMDSCGEEAVMRCSKCKSVKYCSAECQAVHWNKGHKFHYFKPKFDVLNNA